MTYLVRIKDHYYFNRRVPEQVQDYDRRKLIRVSLKTDSKEQAKRKAVILNDQIEEYWRGLIGNQQTHDNCKFRNVVLIARRMGFPYQPANNVAMLPIQELLERVLLAKDSSPRQVEALLGGQPEPEILLDDALQQFWDLAKDKVLNKSEYQVRKWRNPRRKAIENFIALAGNKSLKAITRDDVIAFRDWWIARIKTENKNEDSANKNLLHLKAVVETVSDHHKLGVNTSYLFKKALLKTRYRQVRLPFKPDEIVTILESEKLNRTHKEVKWFLHAMAETGARPAELLGLRPEDIYLDDKIPYIHIREHADRTLKNSHSERTIPLVGYALQAFQNLPQGFSRYKNKSDNLTAVTNKFLRENDLMPSENHTVYSLRHSFQDRVLSVNTPDRVQAELMGHKFHRPKYGNGASLEQKREWLQKVQLRK